MRAASLSSSKITVSKPCTICVDNGPEYISETLGIWAKKQDITIQQI
jgi:hypothetical protein